MTQDEKKPYIDAIQTVKNKKMNVDLSSVPRILRMQTHIFSNTKVPVFRFLLDNQVVTKNNDLVIGYDCLNCSVRNEITLNLYLRKISKNIRCCNACKNLWMDKPLSLRLAESKTMFLNEDSEFQTSYFLNHLTIDEFERIRGKLLSVGQGKLTNLSEWEYVPYFRVWNQSKYTPMLVLLQENRIEKPTYVQWLCEECDTAFVNRDLEIQKNRLRILCADCGFCNRTFKVRSIVTPYGKIRYQNVQERRCIEWFVEKGIPIVNGPRVSYNFDSRVHVYKVDFQLPSLKTLVEIKDNHIWHKRQIASGKWGKKEEAARAWAAEQGWTYEMVFPKTWSKWKEDILVRYSLTLQETVRSKDKEPCDNIGGNL